MWIQQYDVSIRTVVDDRSENRRESARFAGSGSADNAEMFSKELVGQNIGWDRAILVDRPHWGGGGFRAGINLREIFGAGEVDRLVQRRIRGDPPLEPGKGVSIPNLADELEFDESQILVGNLQARQRDPEAGHHAVSDGNPRPHLNQAAHL